MRMIVGAGLFFILAVIAGFHAYWALGGLWPATTEQGLVKTVIGAPFQTRMPAKSLSLLVAWLIFSSALVALVAGGVFSGVPQTLSRVAAFGLGLVFLARGVAGLFGLSIFKVWIAEPFATLNAQFYSPLCLAIGAAFFSWRCPVSTAQRPHCEGRPHFRD